MMPKWLPKGRRDIWENLALGSLGAHVSQGRPGRPRELKIEPQARPDRSELDPKDTLKTLKI